MNTSQFVEPVIDEAPTDPVEYDNWVRAKVLKSLEDPRPSIPHDKVMAQMRALLARKRQNAESAGDGGGIRGLPRHTAKENRLRCSEPAVNQKSK